MEKALHTDQTNRTMATEKRNRDMYPPAAFLRSMDRRKGRGTEDIRKMLRSSKPQRPTNILESR